MTFNLYSIPSLYDKLNNMYMKTLEVELIWGNRLEVELSIEK